MKRIISRTFSVLGTVLLVVLIAVVVVMFDARISGEAPELFGYQIFRVSSGSMEPELMIGDVILVKDVEPTELYSGDTVTYKGEVGDFSDKFITHKLIADPELVDGEYVFHTKGIVSGALEDPLWYEDQLVGLVVCKIPFINAVYNFFLQPYGLIVFIAVIVALFGYELIALLISYKSSEYDEDEEDDEEPEDDNSVE